MADIGDTAQSGDAVERQQVAKPGNATGMKTRLMTVMILISAGLGVGATNTSILLNPPPDRSLGVEVEMQLRRVQVIGRRPAAWLS
ncbi:hypothetical protein [Mesorhizobium sp.]|uniref:hypothetical protein n=1 Tax=Mesorhizobium sp. TaxID=1871066 RepID=UPI0025F82B43|nr:hypothetical protein [Mesorhizobium sp.]